MELFYYFYASQTLYNQRLKTYKIEWLYFFGLHFHPPGESMTHLIPRDHIFNKTLK